jgi:hypothetical protein
MLNGGFNSSLHSQSTRSRLVQNPYLWRVCKRVPSPSPRHVNVPELAARRFVLHLHRSIDRAVPVVAAWYRGAKCLRVYGPQLLVPKLARSADFTRSHRPPAWIAAPANFLVATCCACPGFGPCALFRWRTFQASLQFARGCHFR